ncbi:MAG: hypothetical protein WBP85_14345 [Terracidiphilus sp.]
MEVTKNVIDSEIIGRPVLEISGFDGSCDLVAFEAEYVRRDNPLYVICKLPAEQIADIHRLEDCGFRFVEFQMKLRGTLRKTYDTSGYNYSYLPVTCSEDLQTVLELASTIFEHDRVSRDPFFHRWKGRNISGERYRHYVLKSFESVDECVYKLVDNSTGRIVGFSTHRVLSPSSALLLIGGVQNDSRNSGVGAINDYFALNELKRKGVKWFYTHVSGSNYPIINLEVRGIGFRVVQSFVVMRKIYGENSASSAQ